jgi:hypothetical protein
MIDGRYDRIVKRISLLRSASVVVQEPTLIGRERARCSMDLSLRPPRFPFPGFEHRCDLCAVSVASGSCAAGATSTSEQTSATEAVNAGLGCRMRILIRCPNRALLVPRSVVFSRDVAVAGPVVGDCDARACSAKLINKCRPLLQRLHNV